jgi:hypothetical protein
MRSPLAAPVVAALLLTTSFALAVASITSRFWAVRGVYDFSDPPNLIGFASRSPFSSCTQSVGDRSWDCAWTRVPAGGCDPLTSGNHETAIFCGTLALSGRLLIAACVLLGAGFLLSFGHLLLTARRYRFRHAFLLLAILVSLAGAVCMAVAELAGFLALLALQFPNGEAATSIANDNDILSTWTGGSGMAMASASWAAAAFGAVFLVVGAWAHFPNHSKANGRTRGEVGGGGDVIEAS